MYMRRAVTISLLLLLYIAGVAGGCARTLAVTGKTLGSVGDQFIAVAAIYNAGCASGKITPEQCADFRSFGLHFKQTFPLAVEGWKTARAANDAPSIKRSERRIGILAAGVSALAKDALTAFGFTK